VFSLNVRELVDREFELMNKDKPQNHYYTGNFKQANALLLELLPAIESLLLKTNKEFFTIKETMQMLSISRSQLYYLRKQNVLSSKQIGRKVYITKEAINNLVMNSTK
jgi:predicted DNA-binding transcriptional regulator AlpA